MTELRQLAVFVAIAEQLHFGRAATQLGMPQPRVSVLLQKLESAVGSPLFNRRPNVSLTPAGKAFLPGARASVAQAERAFEEVRRVRLGLSGILYVGFPTWILGTPIPDVVSAFRTEHPMVEIVLSDMGTQSQIEHIADERMHVGFVRQATCDDERVSLTPLFTEAWKLVVPADSEWAAEHEVDLRALRDQRFVGFPKRFAPTVHEEWLGVFQQAGYVPRVTQEAQEWLAIIGLVKAGAGVALVPECVASIWPQALRYIGLKNLRNRSTVSICTNRHALEPPAQRFVTRVLDAINCATGVNSSGSP